ncbi:MAG TPA: hypothetical protein VKU82_04030 [Planctomycetaceae bacterium]|nr:hypothetical protein [Planctomycetaceae bacterium]
MGGVSMANSVGWKELLAVGSLAIALEALLAWCVGIGRPLRGDEMHFVETILQFGTQPFSLDLLTHYNEMSGPLPFLLYGAWGRLAGFEPESLRLLSVIIAVFTYVVWYRFLRSETASPRLALGGAAFLALHPYMLYLSLFIYTDMLAILCLVGALWAVRRERPVWLAIWLCAAALNRQYFVFATLSAGAHYLARYASRRQRRDVSHLLAVAASALPLAALCFVWGGLCPDGALKRVYLDERAHYHLSSLVLYVSLASLYLLPVLAMRWRDHFSHKRLVLFALGASAVYWAYPVAPSASAVEAGIPQVGMLHQSVHRLLGSAVAEHVMFYAGFTAGLSVVGGIVLDAASRWRTGRIDFQFFLDLTIVMFLAVMPFSYLHWEKYFMPLVPVLILRILFVPFSERFAPNDLVAVRLTRIPDNRFALDEIEEQEPAHR